MMDLFKQGMKGPTRPAPSVPGLAVNRYSPVTNWNDDPFGTDVFEPLPQFAQKKKPPPRPPPPKVAPKQPDVPLKPSHFIRKPTVLTSLMSRKNKAAVNTTHNSNGISNTQSLINDFNNELDPHKMFPKCEPKNVQTAALIDLSSPPSSPTFTTRSSSDGLSVDSFGSDATTSTNHQNALNGGNASQAESGFEDDFDLFLTTRKPLAKDDTLDDFASVDPFSSQPPLAFKPPLMKKPILNKDLLDITNNTNSTGASLKGPTIIRAKPARPKPPDNSALLKNTFGSTFPVTSMNINTTTPIQKVCNGFGDNFETKSALWEDDCEGREESSPERDWSPPSPPMPSVPPPPPPATDEDPTPSEWTPQDDVEEPYAIALFDYFTDHPDDLCFSTGAKIKLVRRVDNEWLFGRVRGGAEGLFPANYVEVRVPLPADDAAAPPAPLGAATALFSFEPDQPGDLPFRLGDTIHVMYKLSDEWYFGECNGLKGQFPANYVQMS